MSLLAQFERVTRTRPCSICERPDWCLAGRPGTESEGDSICQRVESDKRYGDAGYLHRGPGHAPRRSGPIRRFIAALREPEGPNLTSLAMCAWVSANHFDLKSLAARLALSPDSLRRQSVGRLTPSIANKFSIGWAEDAWTFPMSSAVGRVVGIRLRMPDGSKRAVPGGHEGLFIPRDLPQPDRLLICEGPTDTAAILDLGFAAIGRPSCNGGKRELVRFVRLTKPRTVVIVADSDSAGQVGAQDLARALVTRVLELRVITPPQGVKDARDWKRGGATRADVQAAIDTAPPVHLTLRVRQGGA